MSILQPINNSNFAPVRVYSPYQEAIFRAFCQGTGNIVVEAVAGSGKTTTLVEALKRWQAVPGNRNLKAVFLAFNKSIADELSRKVPAGVEAKTLHSLCFRAVARRFPGIKVDDHKARDTAKLVAEAAHGTRDRELTNKLVGDLAKAHSLMRGTMTSLSDLGAITETLDNYGVQLDAPTLSLPLLAELDQNLRSETSRCTYDEMLTFAIDHGIPLPQYDLICVDESQDLNLLQIELLKRALSPTGRLVAVGDSRQSIYLFRGADARAMSRIREDFNVSDGNRLPLSITYRCPRSVVALAQQWVPHIQAADGAIEGQVIHREPKQMSETLLGLPVGAMVVCRVNAPLIGAALGLIAKGKKAVVRGRDIGKNVSKLAHKLSKNLSDRDVPELCARIVDHTGAEAIKLRKARKDAQAQQIEDMGETLLALLNGINSLSALDARIENLFSDAIEGVVFTSGHKAKGTEADVVVWLAPEKCDACEMRAKNEAAVAQEINMRYIISTRAMKTLIIQPLPEKEKEEE